jgi:hypothetical protein
VLTETGRLTGGTVSGEPLLRAREVRHRFGRKTVLDGVSIAVQAGEAVAVVGENGARKTTLLRICAGLLAPEGGEVERHGRVVGVPFGLAVGALASGELEAVLLMIGVVGIQLSLQDSDPVAKLLPFWGARRLLEIATGDPAGVGVPVLVGLLYGVALLGAAGWLMSRRLRLWGA